MSSYEVYVYYVNGIWATGNGNQETDMGYGIRDMGYGIHTSLPGCNHVGKNASTHILRENNSVWLYHTLLSFFLSFFLSSFSLH
jgi:hypothetical protein